MVKLIALLGVLSLVGCQTIEAGTFCDIASPVRLTRAQIADLTDAQVRDLLAHNKKGEALCHWKM